MDFTFWDILRNLLLAARWTVGEDGYASRSTNCAFQGRTLSGRVQLTLAAGAVVHRRPLLVAHAGTGPAGELRGARLQEDPR